jgi:SAM-dependent methyltransferase
MTHLADRILRPPRPVAHREDAFDSKGFAQLRGMQERHFWYRGRHRFLLHAVRHHLSGRVDAPLRWLDLGGGCGGWVSYWQRHAADLPVAELALADSSLLALELAAEALPPAVRLYQADLLDLPWRNRWDVMFLLDVIEHLDDDAQALEQARAALAPGGLLFVTVPALSAFWTWNDEISGHRRRYRAADFAPLAARAGLERIDARYFLFLLSPALLASRWLWRPRPVADSAEVEALVEAMHRVPSPVLNAALAAVFACETPLGHHLRFPWGTSALAVFRKPVERPGDG